MTGYLYDLKRSNNGKTVYAGTDAGSRGKRREELWHALNILSKRKFKTAELMKRYFRARTKLYAN